MKLNWRKDWPHICMALIVLGLPLWFVACSLILSR